jgi:hypothetical protein
MALHVLILFTAHWAASTDLSPLLPNVLALPHSAIPLDRALVRRSMHHEASQSSYSSLELLIALGSHPADSLGNDATNPKPT